MYLLPRLPEPFLARMREPIIGKVLPGPPQSEPTGVLMKPPVFSRAIMQVLQAAQLPSAVRLRCGCSLHAPCTWLGALPALLI